MSWRGPSSPCEGRSRRGGVASPEPGLARTVKNRGSDRSAHLLRAFTTCWPTGDLPDEAVERAARGHRDIDRFVGLAGLLLDPERTGLLRRFLPVLVHDQAPNSTDAGGTIRAALSPPIPSKERGGPGCSCNRPERSQSRTAQMNRLRRKQTACRTWRSMTTAARSVGACFPITCRTSRSPKLRMIRPRTTETTDTTRAWDGCTTSRLGPAGRCVSAGPFGFLYRPLGRTRGRRDPSQRLASADAAVPAVCRFKSMTAPAQKRSSVRALLVGYVHDDSSAIGERKALSRHRGFRVRFHGSVRVLFLALKSGVSTAIAHLPARHENIRSDRKILMGCRRSC